MKKGSRYPIVFKGFRSAFERPALSKETLANNQDHTLRKIDSFSVTNKSLLMSSNISNHLLKLESSSDRLKRKIRIRDKNDEDQISPTGTRQLSPEIVESIQVSPLRLSDFFLQKSKSKRSSVKMMPAESNNNQTIAPLTVNSYVHDSGAVDDMRGRGIIKYSWIDKNKRVLDEKTKLEENVRRSNNQPLRFVSRNYKPSAVDPFSDGTCKLKLFDIVKDHNRKKHYFNDRTNQYYGQVDKLKSEIQRVASEGEFHLKRFLYEEVTSKLECKLKTMSKLKKRRKLIEHVKSAYFKKIRWHLSKHEVDESKT